MPDDYDVIVTTLLNMPNPKLVEVEASLMDEFRKKQDKSDQFLKEEQAYLSKHNRFMKKKVMKACGFVAKQTTRRRIASRRRRLRRPTS